MGGITSAAAAVAAVTYANGNAVLALTADQTITIMEVAAGSLAAGDFWIV